MERATFFISKECQNTQKAASRTRSTEFRSHVSNREHYVQPRARTELFIRKGHLETDRSSSSRLEVTEFGVCVLVLAFTNCTIQSIVAYNPYCALSLGNRSATRFQWKIIESLLQSHQPAWEATPHPEQFNLKHRTRRCASGRPET